MLALLNILLPCIITLARLTHSVSTWWLPVVLSAKAVSASYPSKYRQRSLDEQYRQHGPDEQLAGQCKFLLSYWPCYMAVETLAKMYSYWWFSSVVCGFLQTWLFYGHGCVLLTHLLLQVWPLTHSKLGYWVDRLCFIDDEPVLEERYSKASKSIHAFFCGGPGHGAEIKKSPRRGPKVARRKENDATGPAQNHGSYPGGEFVTRSASQSVFSNSRSHSRSNSRGHSRSNSRVHSSPTSQLSTPRSSLSMSMPETPEKTGHYTTTARMRCSSDLTTPRDSMSSDLIDTDARNLIRQLYQTHQASQAECAIDEDGDDDSAIEELSRSHLRRKRNHQQSERRRPAIDLATRHAYIGESILPAPGKEIHYVSHSRSSSGKLNDVYGTAKSEQTS